MPDDEVVLVPAEPEAHTAADAAQIKAATIGAGPAQWRAHLWVDSEAAVAFANANPLAGPGAIVFSPGANGQVWTFYLSGSQIWSTKGFITGQDFESVSNYRMADQ